MLLALPLLHAGKLLNASQKALCLRLLVHQPQTSASHREKHMVEVGEPATSIINVFEKSVTQ